MREIKPDFISDLLSGKLSFFLDKVKNNQELCLEVRKNYVNIYYRGGNLLRINYTNKGYRFHFDTNYCLKKGNDVNHALLSSLSKNNASLYEKHFMLMISEMDEWFSVKPKPEREFQHNLLKANENIIDIEYQIKRSSRFDMLMINDDKLIIVENKYGDDAIGNKSGLAKHYNDICYAIKNDEVRKDLLDSVKEIYNIKKILGLRNYSTDLGDNLQIEILFLLADYNDNIKKISNQIKLINKQYEAKILFMKKNETIINYNTAEDLFTYGS